MASPSICPHHRIQESCAESKSGRGFPFREWELKMIMAREKARKRANPIHSGRRTNGVRILANHGGANT
jgi:hypothetical protein